MSKKVELITKQCQVCTKTFTTKEHTKKFCSRICKGTSDTLQNLLRNPKVVCPICGNRDYRKTALCQKCRPKKNYLKTCPVCNDQNYRKEDLCQIHSISLHKWSLEELNFLTENYPDHGAAYCADALNLSHTVILNKVGTLKLTLTKDAFRKIVHDKAAIYMQENNPSHLPGASERISNRMQNSPDILEKLFLGHAKLQKNTPSKLELKLSVILDDLNIQHETQAIIKDKFVVDVKINNIIIQADGDWWHGHDRFKPLREQQIKQKRRDISQDLYLTACGYIIIRIWESDMSYKTVKELLEKHFLTCS